MAAIFTYSQNHQLNAWQKWASMYGAKGRSKSAAFAESRLSVGLEVITDISKKV
jgi:hypothetical protein